MTRRMTVAIGLDGADICINGIRDSRKSEVAGYEVGERDYVLRGGRDERVYVCMVKYLISSSRCHHTSALVWRNAACGAVQVIFARCRTYDRLATL